MSRTSVVGLLLAVMVSAFAAGLFIASRWHPAELAPVDVGPATTAPHPVADFDRDVFTSPAPHRRLAHVRVRVVSTIELFEEPPRPDTPPADTPLPPAVETLEGSETVFELWLPERDGETFAVAEAEGGRRFVLYLRDPVFHTDRIEYTSHGFALNFMFGTAGGHVGQGAGQTWHGGATNPVTQTLRVDQPMVESFFSSGSVVPVRGEQRGVRTRPFAEYTLLGVQTLPEVVARPDELIAGPPPGSVRRAREWQGLPPNPAPDDRPDDQSTRETLRVRF